MEEIAEYNTNKNLQIKRFHEFQGKINKPSAFMYYIINCVIKGIIPDNNLVVIDPEDVEDFIMIGMLALTNPEISDYLAIMSIYSGSWKGIIDNWDQLINEFFYTDRLNIKELYQLMIEIMNKGRITYCVNDEEDKMCRIQAIEMLVNGKYEEKVAVRVTYHLIPMIIEKYNGKVNISWSWSLMADDQDGSDIYIKVGDILNGKWSNMHPVEGWSMVYYSENTYAIMPKNYMTPGSLKVTFPMDPANENKAIFKSNENFNMENIMSTLSLADLRYNGLI